MKLSHLIAKSFKTVLRNRVIWLFGVFFSLFNSGPLISYSPDETQATAFLARISSLLGGLSGPWLFLLISFLIVVLLAVILLSFAFRGALIDLVRVVGEGGKARAGQGLSAGLHRALPMLGKSLLLWTPFYIIIGLIGWISISLLIREFSGETSPPGGIITLSVAMIALEAVLFIVAGIVIAIVNRIADRFIVIEGSRVFAAVGRAAAILGRNLRPSFLAWLLMFGITVIYLLALGTYIVPVVFLAKAVSGGSTLLALLVIAAAVLLALMPIGFFEAFGSAFWTHFYISLREKEGQRLSGKNTALDTGS